MRPEPLHDHVVDVVKELGRFIFSLCDNAKHLKLRSSKRVDVFKLPGEPLIQGHHYSSPVKPALRRQACTVWRAR